MTNSDDEIIESLRGLANQQPVPPQGWEDDLIRRISAAPVKPPPPKWWSRQGRQAPRRWRPLFAEVGAALAIAAVVVLSIQAVFHPAPTSNVNGPSAAKSPVTSPTTGVSTP